MWYAAKITTPAASEPVTLAEAKAQLRVLADDENEYIQRLISAARDHAERYCGTRFATQTVEVECDSFADFCRLSEAPVQSITSISYVDADGDAQTLGADVFQLHSSGFDASIALKYGKSWPAIRSGERVVVTAVVGFASAPEAVRQAILVFVSDAFENRLAEPVDGWTVFDSLLSNYRRNF